MKFGTGRHIEGWRTEEERQRERDREREREREERGERERGGRKTQGRNGEDRKRGWIVDSIVGSG